jgi:hypothetical protein
MPSTGDAPTGDDPEPLLLRWFERPGPGFCREQPVEIIEARASQAVLSSSIHFLENTEVCLVAPHGTERGTVQSCHPRGAKFIVTIRFKPTQHLVRSPDRDPGVLAVEEFLTEEQELEILRQIEEEMHSEG